MGGSDSKDRAIKHHNGIQGFINKQLCHKDSEGNYGSVCSAVHCTWHGAMVANDNVVNMLFRDETNQLDTSYDKKRMDFHCPNVFDNKQEEKK